MVVDVVAVLRSARRADTRAIGSILRKIGATCRSTSVCRETELYDTLAGVMIDEDEGKMAKLRMSIAKSRSVYPRSENQPCQDMGKGRQ